MILDLYNIVDLKFIWSFLLRTEASSDPSNSITTNIDEVEMTEIKTEPKEYVGENANVVSNNKMECIIKGKCSFIIENILA